ncbi:MAG: tetratricopeptide repeat protein [Pseudomonadota bacterium]
MKYIINIAILSSFILCFTLSQATAASDYQLYLKSGDRSPKWNEFIEPGFQSFDSGNYATSYVFLHRAYDLGCRDGLLLFRLGIFRETQGQYKEAADILAQAAEKIPQQYPNHPLIKSIHEHAGRVLYQADDYDRALPELKKAIESAPDNFMLLFMAGQISRIKKQYAEAKELFERALKAPLPAGAPDARPKVLKELMILSCELKELDACLSYSVQVLAAAPQDATAISYKQKIEQERIKQHEREIMEKMVK